MKNVLGVRNWNFLTGLWKHLASNRMETHLSFLSLFIFFFFFQIMKRVGFFLFWLVWVFFINDPTWRKEQWNNFLALPVMLSCDREKSKTLSCGKRITTFFFFFWIYYHYGEHETLGIEVHVLAGSSLWQERSLNLSRNSTVNRKSEPKMMCSNPHYLLQEPSFSLATLEESHVASKAAKCFSKSLS